MENKKKFFSKSENIIQTTILVLLLIVVFLQIKIISYFNYKKPINSHLNRIEQMRKAGFVKHKRLFDNFDKEMESMRKEREKMLLEMNNAVFSNVENVVSIESNGKTANVQIRKRFIFRPKFKENANEYLISIKTPKEIKKEDVKVDFKDKNLSIEIKKTENNENSFSFDSFARVFYLENGSNKKEDLNVSFDKEELNIKLKKIKK